MVGTGVPARKLDVPTGKPRFCNRADGKPLNRLVLVKRGPLNAPIPSRSLVLSLFQNRRPEVSLTLKPPKSFWI